MSTKTLTDFIKTVGFIGIGKLGMPCAEVMAQEYKVTGYDIYSKTSEKITISDTLEGAVKGNDIIFVAVQTPHDQEYDGRTPSTHLANKDFDYTIVNKTLKDINQYVTKDQLVVLISTVLPGTTRRELKQNITNARFIYNPYLIAMGSVEWDMVNPEMVIIGTEDGSLTGDAKLLQDFYAPLMENNPRYSIGTWDEAEAIKIFYNTFISTKIALVNMIQDVAMKNGNINVGMGDAGPCHPRDNIALRYLAESLDLGYDMFDTIMHAREKQAENIASFLTDLQQKENLPIIIHGKSYKPDVDMVDGSYSLLIGSYLEQQEAHFFYSDPMTNDRVADDSIGIIFLAHNRDITYGYTGKHPAQPLYFIPAPGSIVVDPWRKFKTKNPLISIIQYGNTRKT